MCEYCYFQLLSVYYTCIVFCTLSGRSLLSTLYIKYYLRLCTSVHIQRIFFKIHLARRSSTCFKNTFSKRINSIFHYILMLLPVSFDMLVQHLNTTTKNAKLHHLLCVVLNRNRNTKSLTIQQT